MRRSDGMPFRVPDDTARRKALGSLDGVPPAIRRAFEPDADFEPIPAPARRDWLAVSHEPGQPFDRYVRTTTNRPDSARRTVYLQPLDEFPAEADVTLGQLRGFTEAFFQMPVVLQAPLLVAEHQITVRRNRFTGVTQLLSRDVLKLLGSRVPADACALLGVTHHDLYPSPSRSFVFGEALLDERVGVFSCARYDPRFYDRPAGGGSMLLLRRCTKVLAHETCHMLGLRHCIYYNCLMNGSNHLAESDRRPLHVCPVDLRKLHWAIGFDPIARYRRLRIFWREVGLADEAAWVDRRLERLEAE